MSIDIAVIGMSGRFPGARDISQFWKNLCDGKEGISFFTEEELRRAGIPEAALNDPSYVKAAGILEQPGHFDASFFGYSPREAEVIDPQQRLFLETAWTALESAGYCGDKYEGNAGVYAGTGSPVYLFQNVATNKAIAAAVGEDQIWMGSATDYLATRVSYKLNLAGPGITVQTSCSTSLVAVHLACQDLLTGACDMALAGGVSTGLLEKSGYFYREGDRFSVDGHCRAFDAQASGTVPGSAVGVIVLKRLDEALADDDSILAVIKGSAINNDGANKIGFNAPGVEGQSRVIVEALSVAGISADSIGYVETHGTGTQLGDPIEIAALTRAFREHTQEKNFCPIGSAKSNLGHADAAAGVVGVIKTVLALKHRLLPPTLHFQNANPKIDFDESPFFVNTELRPWKGRNGPLRAGVSSFGLGGTNAHVILEEAPEQPAFEKGRRSHYLVPLSAPTPAALETMGRNLASFCETQPGLDLADVAFTLQAGRKEFSYRRALVCGEVSGVQQLNGGDAGDVIQGVRKAAAPRIAFMFPGGGAQYAGMAAQVYEDSPVFARHFDRCREIVLALLGVDLRKAAFSGSSTELEKPALALTSLFSVNFSLAQLWMAWGLKPEAMIGHSMGEYVAACLGGVMSLEDALDLVVCRGKLFETLPPGAMLSVELPQEEAERYTTDGVSLAAVNAPHLCVLSGPADKIAHLRDTLESNNVECRTLHIAIAAHSQMVEQIVEPFRKKLQRITLKPSRIPFISNVTGTWITPEEVTSADYWATHLRQTVLFAKGIKTLLEWEEVTLVEAGPGQTLGMLAQQQIQYPLNQQVFSSLPHPKAPVPERLFLLQQLAQLWVNGIEIDWKAVQEPERRRRIPLPTYPFESKLHWVERPQKQEEAPLRRTDVASWLYAPSWMKSFMGPAEQAPERNSYLLLADHSGLAEELAQKLRAEGRRATLVYPAREFRRTGENAWHIDPANPEHYRLLIKENRGEVDCVVHLWSCGPALQELNSSGGGLVGEYYSVIYLAQAMSEHEMAASLLTVSNRAQDVLEASCIVPEKSLLSVVTEIAGKELPALGCRNVDFDIADEEITERKAWIVDRLLREIACGGSEPIIAYAAGQRWSPCFQPFARARRKEPLFREGGVYLITGGLGGLGLLIAEHLASTARARLILTGRTASADDPKLSALAAKTEVLVMCANVVVEQEMRAVVHEAKKRFGAIHGVIHSAGVTGGNLVLFTGPSEGAVFEPKIAGTLVLDKVFQDEPIDFMVLFSSLSTVLAPPGQADYSAANHFLNAYAATQSQRKDRHTLAVDWDVWKGIGMGGLNTLPPEVQALHDRNAAQGISAPEGLKAFELALSSGLPRVLVSTRELNALHRQWQKTRLNLAEISEHVQSLPKTHQRPSVSSPYTAPRNELENQIASAWQELLGIEQVGVEDNFFELGGHSLLASRLISRLKSELLVQVPFRKFFESPTIAQLAKMVHELRHEDVGMADLQRALEEVESLTSEQVRGALNDELRTTNR
jgi:acyl transferase domain-containing protein/acyl carrier protein